MTQFSNLDDSFAIRRSDLEAAAAAGILPKTDLMKLARFTLEASGSAAARSEDEQFRFVSGFTDIFVTIGLALFLGALTYLAGVLWPLALPVAAWLLAEVFTRRRRMALPSIVLLGVFAVAVFAGALAWLPPGTAGDPFVNAEKGWSLALAGFVGALAVVAHWWRFRVPITVAAGCAALAAMVAGMVEVVFPRLLETWPAVVFVPMGLLVFAVAMWFDIGDRARRTRRTDIAFWLHLLAAPLIVHPLVWSFTDISAIGTREAAGILALFAALSIVALVVDRRALLVSSLLYLGYALARVFSLSAMGGETSAYAVLLVGAIVLLLSLAWRPMRNLLLGALPGFIRDRVPVANAIYPKAATALQS